MLDPRALAFEAAAASRVAAKVAWSAGSAEASLAGACTKIRARIEQPRLKQTTQ